MNKVGNQARSVTYAVFQPQTSNILSELHKTSHKGRVAWQLARGFGEKALSLLTKFVWFFSILAGWLLLSYVLWVQRRVSVAWVLLWDQQE